MLIKNVSISNKILLKTIPPLVMTAEFGSGNNMGVMDVDTANKIIYSFNNFNFGQNFEKRAICIMFAVSHGSRAPDVINIQCGDDLNCELIGRTNRINQPSYSIVSALGRPTTTTGIVSITFDGQQTLGACFVGAVILGGVSNNQKYTVYGVPEATSVFAGLYFHEATITDLFPGDVVVGMCYRNDTSSQQPSFNTSLDANKRYINGFDAPQGFEDRESSIAFEEITISGNSVFAAIFPDDDITHTQFVHFKNQ